MLINWNLLMRALFLVFLVFHEEYVGKAREADRISGAGEGEVGRVEAKLLSLGSVRGWCVGTGER